MFRLLVFLFIVGCCGTYSIPANSVYDARIIGGFSAENLHIPYIVSVQKFGQHKCGGSIINQRTVLTAAHCISSERPSVLRVLVGSKRTILGDGHLIPVDSLYSHESYNNAFLDYDIGLIRLSRPLQYSVTVQPISLPASSKELIDGTYGMISGWGLTNPNARVGSDVLRFAIVPVVKQSICNKFLGHITEYGKITERMFCAGFLEGGVDSCTMDSGGPFVLDEKLVGIVSWGDGCAEKNKPGVYVRVSAFIPWIKKTMRVQFNEAI